MYKSNAAASARAERLRFNFFRFIHYAVQARHSHHGRKRRSRQNKFHARPRRMVREPSDSGDAS